MPIVSLSFPEQMIKEMDEIQVNGGFTGRSELVRAAIRVTAGRFEGKGYSLRERQMRLFWSRMTKWTRPPLQSKTRI